MHVQLIRMAEILEELESTPCVVDLIDALSLNMERRAEHSGLLKGWFFRQEARRIQAYERGLAERALQMAVTTCADRSAIGSYDNIHVVPHAVDLQRFEYTEEGRAVSRIVFTGRQAYFPNAQAAVWFATKVLPTVQVRLPEVQFHVVGAEPPPAVKRLASLPGVTVTGFVPRIQDYLRGATIAVAPMLTGTGIQTKMLEAMASGAPVVATRYAAPGDGGEGWRTPSHMRR